MRPDFVPLARAMAAAEAQAVVEEVTPQSFALPPGDTPVADGSAPDDIFLEELVAEVQSYPPLDPLAEKPDLVDLPGDESAVTNLSDLVPEIAEADPLPEEADDETPEFVDGLLAMI